MDSSNDKYIAMNTFNEKKGGQLRLLKVYEYTLKIFNQEKIDDSLLKGVIDMMLGTNLTYKMLKILILAHPGGDLKLSNLYTYFKDIVKRSFNIFNENLTEDLWLLLTYYAIPDNKLSNQEAKLFLNDLTALISSKYYSTEILEKLPTEIQYIITALKYKQLSIYLRLIRTDGITSDYALLLIDELKETEQWYIDYTNNLSNNYGSQ